MRVRSLVLTLVTCASALALFGCKKEVARADCEAWRVHFLEMQTKAQAKIDACRPKPELLALWKQSASNAQETTTHSCGHLADRAVPKPEEVSCYLKATTSAEIDACKVAEDTVLYDFAHPAHSLDPSVATFCAK